MTIQLYSDFLIDNAQKYPDRMAVIAADRNYTYRELNLAANRFANGLKARGIREGDRIMVALPKDSKPFVAMHGIMKIGAVLIPVSSAYPEGRLKKIREDSGAVMMVGTPGDIGDVMFDDIMDDGNESEPARPAIDGSGLCMILYTSGSTGNPKGVMLRHRGYVTTSLPLEDNGLAWNIQRVGHTFLGVTTTTFAFFYMEYCICCATACTYVMADLEHSRSPMLMAEDMLKYRVDVVAGTPSRIMQYLDIPVFAEAVKRLHILIVGGERIPVGMAEGVHAIAKDCVIMNGYSQTEGNGPMIAAVVESAESLGYQHHGWIMRVVDENNNETKDGEPGELLMAGDNMMAGYLNLPEEMAARTVVLDGIPFFRTGDIVRRFAGNGYLIVGRKDHQIKLRGLRMEPGEIEAVIQRFEGTRIEKAVVQVKKIHGAEHLCAYYFGAGAADEEALRKHMQYDLPAYMIPDYFMYLEKVPLNQNGKLDLQNLPEFRVEDHEIIAPADELERGLLETCRRIVGYEGFGVTTLLQEAGFTSLTYIELASYVLDNSHVELRLTDLMAGKETVRTIAERIRHSTVIEREQKQLEERYPLTPQLYQFTAAGPMSDLNRKFTFSAKWTDAQQIRSVFMNTLNSFPYLFSTFRKEGGAWFQIPHPGAALTEEDIRILPGEPSQEETDAFFTPYDLATADRLIDVRVYAGERVIVLMHVQHILMDHVFMEKLLADIRIALKMPDYRPAEQADYFAYTTEAYAWPEKPAQEGAAAVPHPVGKQLTAQNYVEIGKMTPVLSKYRLQPAEYLFGLVSQAFLRATGRGEAVIHFMFGGRNEARYFHTAGYFPLRIPVPVREDPDFCGHVGKAVVKAFRRAVPTDDYGYRAMVRHEYGWPNITYNCMDYIEGNEDFEVISLPVNCAETAGEISRIAPHISFTCYILSQKAAVVNLAYDPEALDGETAKKLMDGIRALADEMSRSV